jgi:hypothetical protein
MSTAEIINTVCKLKQKPKFLDVNRHSIDFKIGHRLYRAKWDYETHTIYVVSIREKFRYQIGDFDEPAQKMMKELNSKKVLG